MKKIKVWVRGPIRSDHVLGPESIWMFIARTNTKEWGIQQAEDFMNRMGWEWCTVKLVSDDDSLAFEDRLSAERYFPRPVNFHYNWVYHGTDGHQVTVDGDPLPLKPSLSVRNHSPSGFSWGYGGSGPAQLALALLLHEGVEPDEAADLHQSFKFEVVGKMHDEWRLTSIGIWQWVLRAREKIARQRALEASVDCIIPPRPGS